MSEKLRNTYYNGNQAFKDDVAYKVESYSDEAGDMNVDPFANHFGIIIR